MTATDQPSTRYTLATPQPYRTRLHDDAHARQLLEGALNRCYCLPSEVAGFAAEISVQIDDQTWHGSALVDVHQRVRVMLADVAAQTWVTQTLHRIAAHAWDAFGSARARRAALVLDATPHPLGARIHLRRDALHTHYRVCDGALSEYVRDAAPETTTTQIITYQTLANGAQLPQVCTTFACKQGSGRLMRGESTTDTYVEHNGVWLLAERRMCSVTGGTMMAACLRLERHRLLEAHEVSRELRPRAKRQHVWN